MVQELRSLKSELTFRTKVAAREPANRGASFRDAQCSFCPASSRGYNVSSSGLTDAPPS